MDTFDFGVIAPDLLAQKIFNAQTIKEAAALVQLCHQDHPVLSKTTRQPVNWGIDQPLCQRCWQELSDDDGFCPLCREVSNQIQLSKIRANTGILIFCQNETDLFTNCQALSETIPVKIRENEVLVLLPSFEVANFLVFIKNHVSRNTMTNIVFPGQGDMTFGDALSIARYVAGSIQIRQNSFMTKFYFSHSHMRAFDFENFLDFDILSRLFEMASVIKTVFSRDEKNVIAGLLKKDPINRAYELKRFYSMCGRDQKSVLDRIQIDRIEAERGLLLFDLVRYVYRND